MKTYEYTAVAPNGDRVRSTTRARSEADLDREIEARGLLLAEARVVSGEGRKVDGRMTSSELLSFTTQLATVSGAGVPLVDGLRSIGARLEKPRSRELVADMVAGLSAGESLSDVMSRHPRAFPPVYRSSVVAGEAAGSLDTVLERLAKYLEWSRTMRATATHALIYPTILLGAITGLIVILLYFVLPRILKLFPGGAGDLPTETRIVLLASNFLRDNVLILSVVATAGTFAFFSWLRTPRGRLTFDGLLLRVPKLGAVQAQIATSRFASTAAILQAAGCDVFTVLNVAARACGNSAMEQAFGRATDSVRRGSTITDGLDREPRVDPLLKQMVGVGEKSGELDSCLERLVRYYDEEIPRTVKRFLAVVEPLMLILAGAIVAFILLAALMPIFRLYEKM